MTANADYVTTLGEHASNVLAATRRVEAARAESNAAALELRNVRAARDAAIVTAVKRGLSASQIAKLTNDSMTTEAVANVIARHGR